MRDRHFREDENELPYLVSQTRDDSFSQTNCSRTNEEKLDDILNSMNITLLQRLTLKNKVISFLNAKDCISLTVNDMFDAYIFVFTRKNEYIETTHELEYYPDFDIKRIFQDCYTSHNYDNLIRNSRFKGIIKKTGLEFLNCKGGYLCKYSMADDEFTFEDEMDIGVWFKAGSKKRLYKLDLDRMELSSDYFESYS